MFEEDLINAVRKYPCLYDKNSKTSDKAQQIIKRCWENVSTEAGESVERCQSRWRSLRDRFVKENKNYVKWNQSSMWKFMESLEFLRDFIDTRRKKLKSLEQNFQDILQTNNEENHDGSLFSNSNNDCDEEISNYLQKISERKKESLPQVEASIETPINELQPSLDFHHEDLKAVDVQTQSNLQHATELQPSLDFHHEDLKAVDVQTQSNLQHAEAPIETKINGLQPSSDLEREDLTAVIVQTHSNSQHAEASIETPINKLQPSLNFGHEDLTAVNVQTQSNSQHAEAMIEMPNNEPPISQSFKNAIRSRTRARDAEAKFDMLVDTLNEYIKCSISDRKKKKDDDFFGLLNTYLSKLPEKEQDTIKADILLMVLSKTRQT